MIGFYSFYLFCHTPKTLGDKTVLKRHLDFNKILISKSVFLEFPFVIFWSLLCVSLLSLIFKLMKFSSFLYFVYFWYHLFFHVSSHYLIYIRIVECYLYLPDLKYVNFSLQVWLKIFIFRSINSCFYIFHFFFSICFFYDRFIFNSLFCLRFRFNSNLCVVFTVTIFLVEWILYIVNTI